MGSGALFLSRCERNNDIDELFVASPSNCFVPLTTLCCSLFPLTNGSSPCFAILLLTLVVCFRQGSATNDHGVICTPKGRGRYTSKGCAQ
jgi:hypothetical protein